VFLPPRRERNRVLYLIDPNYEKIRFTMTQTTQFGKYKHYKGYEYIAITQVSHTETCETMVLYAPLYGDSGLWVRPFDMFYETITVDGKEVERFTYLGEPTVQELEHVKAYFNGVFDAAKGCVK